MGSGLGDKCSCYSLERDRTVTLNDKVNHVFDDLLQTYKEAIDTYGRSVAMAALAYAAATAVHSMEHEPQVAAMGAHNARSACTGVWVDSFHAMLFEVRAACDAAQKQGLH